MLLVNSLLRNIISLQERVAHFLGVNLRATPLVDRYGLLSLGQLADEILRRILSKVVQFTNYNIPDPGKHVTLKERYCVLGLQMLGSMIPLPKLRKIFGILR